MFGARASAMLKRPANVDQTIGGVDFDDSEDRVRLSILPTNANNLTFNGWAYYDASHSGGGTYNGIVAVEDDPGHSTEYNELLIEDGDLVFYDQGPGGSGRLVMTIGTVPVNTWFNTGFTVDPATNIATAWMGVHGGSLTFASALIYPCATVGVTSFGRTVYTIEYFGGALSNWHGRNVFSPRHYIESQFRSVDPVSYVSQLGWWKMENVSNVLVDSSSVGNTLTELGTATRANVTGPTVGG